MKRSKPELALVFDFDSYAGNFERQFFAHLTGYSGTEDDFHSFARPFATEKLQEDLFESLFDGRLGEYGVTNFAIWPNPAYWNDGHGTHTAYADRQPAPDARVYDAYNSVAVFLQRELSREEMAMLCSRAKTFPAAFLAAKYGGKIQLCGIRLERAVIETTWEVIR